MLRCQTANPRAHLKNILYQEDETKPKPFSVCLQKPQRAAPQARIPQPSLTPRSRASSQARARSKQPTLDGREPLQQVNGTEAAKPAINAIWFKASTLRSP